MLTLTPEKVQTGRIFSEFKKRIQSLGKLGALKNLYEIKEASESYAQLLGDPRHQDAELRDSFERMNRYSDTHRVFLLGMMSCGLPIEAQRLLTRAVEHLSFRWIGAGANAQDLETLYQRQVLALIAMPSADKAVSVAGELMKAAPSDEALDGLTRSDSIELQRYILRRIESSTGGAIAGAPHIEHLAPQGPARGDDYWYSAVAPKENSDPDSENPTYEEYVTNWGNLTLLEAPLNKSIKNKDWRTKVKGTGKYKGISASNYNINDHLKTMNRWTADDILRREKYLIECIQQLVGINWVKGKKSTIEMWDGS
jgi:hypothetical protein